jgi:hypothetical protein
MGRSCAFAADSRELSPTSLAEETEASGRAASLGRALDAAATELRPVPEEVTGLAVKSVARSGPRFDQAYAIRRTSKTTSDATRMM